jgi:hypothetical protein
MTRPQVLWWLAVIPLCAVLACGQNNGQSTTPDEVQANPARPTVATPATLTPVGYLQFENGALYAEGSPEFSGRTGFNQVTKLTVHPRLEFLVASEPLVYSGQNGSRSVDFSGVSAGAQAVLLAGEKARPTLAVSYIRTLHSGAAPDIDIGTPQNSFLLLVSDDLHGFHFDVNGILNEQTQDRVRRAQFGHTVSVSHGLKKWTISGELWRFTQPFLRGNAVGNLWALSYQPRPNLVLDAGFNRGLTSTSTQWEAFVGFTYLLPHRLWKKGAEKSEKPGETNKRE